MFYFGFRTLLLEPEVPITEAELAAHLLNQTSNKLSFHPSANSSSIANNLIMWDVNKRAIHKEHVNFRHANLDISVNFTFKS